VTGLHDCSEPWTHGLAAAWSGRRTGGSRRAL